MSNSSDPFRKLKEKLKTHPVHYDSSMDEDIERHDSAPEEDNTPSESIMNENVLEEKEYGKVIPDPVITDDAIPQLEYVFFPRPEITVFDLARILAMTQLMITDDVYNKFPDDLKKFFVRFEDMESPQKI